MCAPFVSRWKILKKLLKCCLRLSMKIYKTISTIKKFSYPPAVKTNRITIYCYNMSASMQRALNYSFEL